MLDEVLKLYDIFSFLAPYKFLLMGVLMALSAFCIVMALKAKKRKREDE